MKQEEKEDIMNKFYSGEIHVLISKFDAKDAAQGIFFVPETGEAVRATVIAENKPARLMAIIPAGLKAGTYYIEVRTKLSGGGKPLKVVKVGRFAKPLTVTP